MASTDLPVAHFDNYPLPAPESGGPSAGRGAARGTLIGMGAAACTVLAMFPPLQLRGYALQTLIGLLVAMALGAVIGAAPGAVVGVMLTGLARHNGPPTALRIVGAGCAAGLAFLVGASIGSAGAGAVIVAMLCGAWAAPWVAQVADRTQQ